MYEQISDEFDYDGEVWVCPDVSKFVVNNDLYNMYAINSTSFGLVINGCNDATAIDSEHSLSTYTNESCLDDSEFTKQIDKLIVNTKIIN